MGYQLSARASKDIEEIQRFISVEMQNHDGAVVVTRYLFEAFERIGADPAHARGRRRHDLTNRPYKFLTVRKYVVVYDDRSSPVTIMAVLGGSRDLPTLLAADPLFSDDQDI